jgi:exodeoxyribonuclease VII large subunit
VPEKSDLLRRTQELRKTLCDRFLDHLEYLNKRINEFSLRLRYPKHKVQEFWQRIDDLNGRLARTFKMRLLHERDRQKWFTHRLNAGSPRIQLEKNNSRLNVIKNNLLTSMNIILSKKMAGTRENSVRLDALNPLAILQRGYSVTRSLPEKKVLTSPEQVYLNQEVEILLAAGLLLCKVKEKSAYGKENL